jgi:VIT family protein
MLGPVGLQVTDSYNGRRLARSPSAGDSARAQARTEPRAGRDIPLPREIAGCGYVSTVATAAVALLALAGLGFIGARIGGADELRATIRVTVWDAIAMAFTYAIGAAV